MKRCLDSVVACWASPYKLMDLRLQRTVSRALWCCLPWCLRTCREWCVCKMLRLEKKPTHELKQVQIQGKYLSLKRLEKDDLLSDFSMSFLQCLTWLSTVMTWMVADASTSRHICTSSTLRPCRLAWHCFTLVTVWILPPNFTWNYTTCKFTKLSKCSRCCWKLHLCLSPV